MFKETDVGNPNKPLISGNSNGHNEDDIIPNIGNWILGTWPVLPVHILTSLVPSWFLLFLASMCFPSGEDCFLANPHVLCVDSSRMLLFMLLLHHRNLPIFTTVSKPGFPTKPCSNTMPL